MLTNCHPVVWKQGLSTEHLTKALRCPRGLQPDRLLLAQEGDPSLGWNFSNRSFTPATGPRALTIWCQLRDCNQTFSGKSIIMSLLSKSNDFLSVCHLCSSSTVPLSQKAQFLWFPAFIPQGLLFCGVTCLKMPLDVEYVSSRKTH